MATTADYQAMARSAAIENGIDPALFMGLVQQESRWNPNARSPVGAFGLTQIMPDTAAKPGFDLRGLSGQQLQDPMSQLRFGARYLKAMLTRYDGDVDKALAAYNWGAGNVDKNGLNNLPAETSGYIGKVKGFADDFGSNAYALNGPTGPDSPMISGGDFGYVTENSWADSPYRNATTVGSDRDYDTFGTGPGEHLDRGGTGQTSGVGGIIGSTLKGGMVGGIPGLAGGLIMGIVREAFDNREEQKVRDAGLDPDTPEGQKAMAANRQGFGWDDAIGLGVQGIMGGNPLGAVGGVAAGLAGNAVDTVAPDQNPNQYGAGDVIRDVVGGVVGGNAVGGLGKAASGLAGQTARNVAGTPEDDGSYGLDDAAQAGLRGFMSGGPIGAVGSVIGGFMGNKLESWADRQKAKAKGEQQAGLGYSGANAAAGVDAGSSAYNDYVSDVAANTTAGAGIVANADRTQPGWAYGDGGGSRVTGDDALSDSLRDAGL
jgi:hypothetical protein